MCASWGETGNNEGLDGRRIGVTEGTGRTWGNSCEVGGISVWVWKRFGKLGAEKGRGDTGIWKSLGQKAAGAGSG